MTNLVSIGEVAKAMGWSYHRTRNRLARNPKTQALSQKVGHAVCYESVVLDLIREPESAPVHPRAKRIWNSLRGRSRLPKYQGVSVAWENKSDFYQWFNENWDPSHPEYQLDKDILVPGNKVYGPDTCCFVPQWLNILISQWERLDRTKSEEYNRRIQEAEVSPWVKEALRKYWRLS